MDTTLTNYQECKAKQIKEKPFTMASIQKNYKKVSKLGTIITVVKSKLGTVFDCIRHEAKINQLFQKHYGKCKEQFRYRIHGTQIQKMV